jgi:hypothetical protein
MWFGQGDSVANFAFNSNSNAMAAAILIPFQFSVATDPGLQTPWL